MKPKPAGQPEEWLWRSQYDIETAEAMLKSGRYLYVVFCCQQAVEKRLKAILAAKTDQAPPKIHDLLRLAKLVDVHPKESQAVSLGKLNVYYIEGRYPEEVSELMAGMDADLAGQVVQETRELLSWLAQQKS